MKWVTALASISLLLAVSHARPNHNRAAIAIQDDVQEEDCSALCGMFHAFLDQDHDGYTTLDELVKYFDEFDQRKIGRRNVIAVAELLMKLDRDGDSKVDYAELSSFYPELANVRLSMSPSEVHLSLVNNNNIMVMWVTKEATATSTVQYGLTNDSLINIVQGSTHTYTAGGWKGVIHQVELVGLANQTQYYYRVGDAVHGYSNISAFVTQPNANDTSVHIVGMFGDMGTVIPAGFEVCKQMEDDNSQLPFQLLVHVGDIAYASVQSPNPDPSPTPIHKKTTLSDEQEEIWDLWATQVEPLASQIPYITGVGNHEKFYNYSSYLARFNNPLPWGQDEDDILNSTFWFSLDYGRVHYTFMSTEHPYTPGSPQYEWLQQDLMLANQNRENVPWLILTGHRPMYSSDADEESSHWPGAPFQLIIEPLMQQAAVDMYVCGHMHMYERINPVLNGTVYQTGDVYHNPGAPVHVVQGTSGVFQDFKFVHPQPDWSANRMGKLGYGRMHVFNATHIYYEFLGLESRAQEDAFWLIKD